MARRGFTSGSAPKLNTSRYIPVGGRPRSKAEAWWALSKPAKELLATMRSQGMFGGQVGQAPYWMSQEAGNPAAMIEQKRYIFQAVQRWKNGRSVRIKTWLGT